MIKLTCSHCFAFFTRESRDLSEAVCNHCGHSGFPRITNVKRSVYPVTRKRLKKAFKYCIGKRIRVSYEYNNSLEQHEERIHTGVLDKFEVETLDVVSWKEFRIRFKFAHENNYREESVSSFANFTGFGRIEECNGGPYNYLTLEILKIDLIERALNWLRRKFL